MIEMCLIFVVQYDKMVGENYEKFDLEVKNNFKNYVFLFKMSILKVVELKQSNKYII